MIEHIKISTKGFYDGISKFVGMVTLGVGIGFGIYMGFVLAQSILS